MSIWFDAKNRAQIADKRFVETTHNHPIIMNTRACGYCLSSSFFYRVGNACWVSVARIAAISCLLTSACAA